MRAASWACPRSRHSRRPHPRPRPPPRFAYPVITRPRPSGATQTPTRSCSPLPRANMRPWTPTPHGTMEARRTRRARRGRTTRRRASSARRLRASTVGSGRVGVCCECCCGCRGHGRRRVIRFEVLTVWAGIPTIPFLACAVSATISTASWEGAIVGVGV